MGLIAAGGMILIALFLLRSEWEKLQLKTVREEIRTGKPVSGQQRCSDGRKRLRLLFVSDLHTYLPAMHMPEKIVQAVDEVCPDAVLIGGDMITVRKDRRKPEPETGTALALIGRLAEKYPVYYGEGNHESRLRERNPEAYTKYVSSLLKFGVRYLADTSTPLLTGGPKGICDSGADVTGITLEEEFYAPCPGIGLKTRLPEGYLGEKYTAADPERFQILLLHHPGFLKEAAEEGIDLVLSGHMHGGTIRLPDGSGLMTPQYSLFVKECSGSFADGNTKMIVSAGLGTHSIRIRFNDLPELNLIDIIGPEEEKDGTEGAEEEKNESRTEGRAGNRAESRTEETAENGVKDGLRESGTEKDTGKQKA